MLPAGVASEKMGDESAEWGWSCSCREGRDWNRDESP